MTTQAPKVLIVGAGSMGLVTGYHLQLAGAEVVFLIRPHREEELKRPQILYSYDDNTLKEYKGYDYITSPARILEQTYDFIIVTLDGTALKAPAGQDVVKKIGEAARRDVKTKIILGSVGVQLLPWFIDVAAISKDQITCGCIVVHIYPPKAVTLPLHPPTDPNLLAQADQAYTAKLGGYFIDDSSPIVQQAFAKLWDAAGLSKCVFKTATQLSLEGLAFFAVYAVCGLLDWPSFQEIQKNTELWTLAIECVKEIQRLPFHGEAGQLAASATTGDVLAGAMAGIEQLMLPMDFQEFNRYHHGGKVNTQDREILATCVRYGEADGQPMRALKDLVRRVEAAK